MCSRNVLTSLLLHVLLLLGAFASASTASGEKVHIVYLGETNGRHPDSLTSGHHNMLFSVLGSMDVAKESILYSYKHGFNGFAASLTEKQADEISKMPGVVSVFPTTRRALHTTRSWEFLGLTQESASSIAASSSSSTKNIWERAKFGSDVIIGLLDTGIWPESESFKDDMLSDIPSRWKGTCETGARFSPANCNKKLIGARMYLKGFANFYKPLNVSATGEFFSARDKDGHGTHTSSTAAGSFVPDASIFGFANGTAKGGAPSARIAMYKVCWPVPGGSASGEDTCFEEDMLAALDQGIKDGVDVFSISIGSGNPQPNYLSDGIAIGTFHAVKKNILVSCSAGNSGPAAASVANVAPWILTVAASSLDRDFPSNVLLKNGTTIQGKSIAPKSLSNDRWYELIDGGRAPVAGVPAANASQCLPNTLDTSKVSGKVVICLRGQGTRVGKSQEALRAGAAGFILGNSAAQANEVSVDAYMLPGTAINADNANVVLSYISKTSNPLVKIIPATTVVDFKPAPSMAAFSSQGPNSLHPDILKPDISAPGLNILAAWTQANSPTKQPGDNRVTKYNIISGTSMSCPHVAGTAALLKAIYPSWSPAAIKSALMTTASHLNNMGEPILNGSGAVATSFNFGSGEVNPEAAADPGLVYDTTPEDYLRFLCNVGYQASQIQNSTATPGFTCPPSSQNATVFISDLNYPSIAVTRLSGTRIVKRAVTNVGADRATYTVTVEAPPGVSIDIEPSTLSFTETSEQKAFSVTLRAQEASRRGYTFGSYHWSDGTHVVRSPIVVSLA